MSVKLNKITTKASLGSHDKKPNYVLRSEKSKIRREDLPTRKIKIIERPPNELLNDEKDTIDMQHNGPIELNFDQPKDPFYESLYD